MIKSSKITCAKFCAFRFSGTPDWYSVEYSSFSVGPEADKYRLNVAGFSGDERDALAATVHPGRLANGSQFSTPDQDNDKKEDGSGRCERGITGWWFRYCGRSVLNFDTNAMWNADTDDYRWDVVFARMLVKLDD